MVEHKICKHCQIEKEVISFCKDSKTKDGYARWCKECLYISNRASYRKNKEKIKQRHKIWREKNVDSIKQKKKQKVLENPTHNMYSVAKWRAKKYNLPFDIEIEDIVIPEYCPILGVKLEKGIRKSHSFSPSIDKIIPELGYIKGNIQVISGKANTMKSNASFKELLTFAKWIEQNIRPLCGDIK